MCDQIRPLSALGISRQTLWRREAEIRSAREAHERRAVEDDA